MENAEDLKILQLKLLNETRDFYSFDTKRRATNSDRGCYYRTIDGRMCAIGRIAAVSQHELQSWLGVVNYDKCSKLKFPYNTFNYDFLNELQQFHDHASNWDANGLTKLGQEEYELIKEKHCI